MSKKLLLAATVAAFALLAPLALAACGGDDDSGGSSADEDQITQAIEAAATSGDPSACTKYETLRFVEQTGNGKGQAAIKSCEKDAADSVADKVDVSDVNVDGNSATAKAAVTGSFFDGQTLDIGLVKEGGQWKLDEFKGFAEFNRDAFLAAFRHELATSEGGAPAAAVDCVIKQAGGLSDEQLEGVFTGGNKQAEDQIFKPCAQYFKGQ
jgi:hypothetical protein